MKVIHLDKLCEECEIHREVIIEYIKNEWIVPVDSQMPRFDEEDMARVKLITELKQEFEVNDEAMPIILGLIDQLNRLQLEVSKRRQAERP